MGSIILTSILTSVITTILISAVLYYMKYKEDIECQKIIDEYQQVFDDATNDDKINTGIH